MQLGLQFNAPRRDASEDSSELSAYLRGVGWMTAEQIGVALGWSDRRVRRAASLSDEIISWPGSPGYKHLQDCTREEYDRFRAATRHQAREMIARVLRADRRWFGGPQAL